MEEAKSNSQAFVAHSFTPKRFTHLCRALYADAILVYIAIPFWCTSMAAGNQQKHLEFIFSIKALSFHSRTSIRTHKHIFLYLQWLYCWKSRGETFHTRQHSYLVSLTVKTRKFKLLYFRNETCYGNGNLYRDLLFVYLQPSEIRIRKSSLFRPYHLMTSLWKPSISTLSNIYCSYPLTTTQEDHFTSCENIVNIIQTSCPPCLPPFTFSWFISFIFRFTS